jgi:hypothetical protein
MNAIPSKRRAGADLKHALAAIDAWREAAVDNLPAGHSWSDIDRIEIERCDAVVKAYDAQKRAVAEFGAYVAAHGDE